MRDALLLQKRPPQATVIFAASQLQGSRDTQEDYFVNWNDECFVVCDGVGGLPHGEVAAKLAADTAVWAYKHVRQRHSYWKDRKLFLKRIFRTTNITLWQKQREEGFTDGMATTMMVAIVIDRNFYLGWVGDSSAYLLRDGNMAKLTTEDVDEGGRLTKAMGTTRYGLVPRVSAGEMLIGDSIILMTDGLSRAMDTDKCVKLVKEAGQGAPQLSDVAVNMLGCAQDQGATDNMTVVLIKRTT